MKNLVEGRKGEAEGGRRGEEGRREGSTEKKKEHLHCNDTTM
jgi:hypothetical protein